MTVDGTKRVAIVTGSSSGIGYETALGLAENGIITYATMRDTKKGSSILNKAQSKNLPIKVIELDVDDDKSVEKAIQEITINENRIDILVNNAGFGLIGAAEKYFLLKKSIINSILKYLVSLEP